MIKVIRVDHRLLHGQVIFSWTKSANIERVIIIDTNTAKDDFKKMTLKLAKPENVRLNVFSLKMAIDKLEEINYGLIPSKPNAKRFSNVVYLTPKEIELTKNLCDQGIKVSMQPVPSSLNNII